MPHVSRCQGGVPRHHNARDLSIAHVYGLPHFRSCRSQQCCCIGRCAVEIQYTVFKIFTQQLVKSRFKRLSPPARRQQCQAKAGFEQSNARDPDGFGRLPVQPCHHCRLRSGAHQRA